LLNFHLELFLLGQIFNVKGRHVCPKAGPRGGGGLRCGAPCKCCNPGRLPKEKSVRAGPGPGPGPGWAGRGVDLTAAQRLVPAAPGRLGLPPSPPPSPPPPPPWAFSARRARPLSAVKVKFETRRSSAARGRDARPPAPPALLSTRRAETAKVILLFPPFFSSFPRYIRVLFVKPGKGHYSAGNNGPSPLQILKIHSLQLFHVYEVGNVDA
jgi:hypothetical protein